MLPASNNATMSKLNAGSKYFPPLKSGAKYKVSPTTITATEPRASPNRCKNTPCILKFLFLSFGDVGDDGGDDGDVVPLSSNSFSLCLLWLWLP